MKYDRSNRVPAFGAFPSARRLANATRTGLKMEIETEGTTSKFQRQLVSREALGNFSCQVAANDLSHTHENVVSKIVYLSTDFCEFNAIHSIFFFFLFLSHVYFFSFYSHKLSLTLSPSFSLYSSRSTVTSRAQRRGLFLFFFSFFYLRNIVWHRVRVSSVFPYYEIKRFLCRLVACQHLLGWENQRKKEKKKNGNSQIRVVQRKVR